VVLLDAGYGNNSELRADITALGLTYAAGILSTTPLGWRGCPAAENSRRPPLRSGSSRVLPSARRYSALGLDRSARPSNLTTVPQMHICMLAEIDSKALVGQ
jgi:DDE superfamily endonuclease